MKKYVPRSIQNIFDRVEAFNESITEKLFSEPLPTTFEVIVCASKNPEVKTPRTSNVTDDSSSINNYYYYKARSLSGHHDHLTRPETATTVDQYKNLKCALPSNYKKVHPTSSNRRCLARNDDRANLVTLVSKERSLSISLTLADGAAKSAHAGRNPTGTNADHASTKIRVRRSERPKKAKLEESNKTLSHF